VTPPVWVLDLAGRFWAAAGPPAGFPRDIAAAAQAGLPVRVVTLPDLTLTRLTEWLARCGVPSPDPGPDRRLRAGLVGRGGWGFLFLDAADPADERRFSAAHEVAHFLRDYAAPRQAAGRVGPAALAVLDGTRPATAGERVDAVLRGVRLTPHAHLLGRDGDGRPLTPTEREAEAAADRLAFELLAPADRFGPGEVVDGVERRLVAEFGLPAGPAAEYARLLVPPGPPAGRLVARLREILTPPRRTPGGASE